MSRHPISVSGIEPSARVTLEPFGISFEVSLAPAIDWWRDLRERNRRVREAEDLEEPLGSYRFVRRCPSCLADFSHLALLQRGSASVRVCMTCRHEISP